MPLLSSGWSVAWRRKNKQTDDGIRSFYASFAGMAVEQLKDERLGERPIDYLFAHTALILEQRW
jgi:hypothetical protein